MLNQQMLLDEKVSFLPILMDYYKSLVNVGRQDEAWDIKNEFTDTLQETLELSTMECEQLADTYRKKGEYLKAILLYQASEKMYTGQTETDEITNCLQRCALGLKLSVTALVKQRPDLRRIVSDDVVPAIRRVYDKLSSMMDAHGEKMVLIRSLCLHHIETTELVSDNNSVREKTLREAIRMMDQELMGGVSKFNLYSAHVNNLAVTCMSQDRPAEAVELFTKAIEYRNIAEDYNSSAERTNDLAMSQEGLRKAHEMLAYMQ